MAVFREDKPPDKDITYQEQERYEAELVVRARLGRRIMAAVCVINLLVSFLIPLTGACPVMFCVSALSLMFTLKGRRMGKDMQSCAAFILSEASVYALIYLSFSGIGEQLQSMMTYFGLLFVYGAVCCLYVVRSRNIESWFEYANSYKCRYLGKRFFGE